MLRRIADLPLGVAPLVMLAIFFLTAPLILAWSVSEAGAGERTLEFWVFAETHYDEYEQRVPLFENEHPGWHVKLSLLPGNVLADKLMASFLSDTGAPDLVEVEIGVIGRFFLGTKDDCGFVDLKPYLEERGLMDELVVPRLVPYTNRGSLYGIPHDVHPVVLLYRWDLLEEVGINDLEAEVETWDDFAEAFSRPGVLDTNGDGRHDRYAIMTTNDSSRHLQFLLCQRGMDFFDAEGNVLVDDPLCIDTMEYVHKLFEMGLAIQQPAWGPDLYGPMKEDRLYCVFAPDWFVGLMETYAPELAEKWRAMPLPAWEPGGRRTSTFGGTMIGLTKQCPENGMAWELLEFLYFDPAVTANRFEHTKIIPPVRSAWGNPIFSEPDGYVLGPPPLGEALTRPADDIPPTYQNQYAAETLLLMDKAVYRVLMKGTDAKAEFGAVAEEMRRKIDADRFRAL